MPLRMLIAAMLSFALAGVAPAQPYPNKPIKWVIPTSGTPLLVDGIAIVAGTKHPKEAREYYEYVTTPDAMIAAADSFLRIPARKDIPVSKLPAWIRDAMAQIKPMPVDRDVMAAHLDEWMKYWDANIRNRGQRQ